MVKILLTSPHSFARITVDLLGDGQPGWTVVGDKLQYITELSVQPTRRGTFTLDIEVLDVLGCSDKTGTSRTVIVR